MSEFLIAPYDIETNGLLEPKRDKNQAITEPAMDRVHGVCFALMDGKFNVLRWISAADQPGYEKGTFHYTLPGRVDGEGFPVRTVFEPLGFTPPAEATVWERMPIVDALELLATADIRVAHNGQDFDERAIKLVYPKLWPPKRGKLLDTLLLSRVTYPDIHRTGPNKHKLFSFEQRMHGVQAWGKRLGVHKGEYTDWCKKHGIDPWAQWREEMQAYNEDDVIVLIAILKWLWAQKTDQRAVDLEHEFGSIIRRQERHGWAFDKAEAEDLLTELQIKEANLELGLIGQFGSWWAPVRRGKSGAEDDLKAAWKDQDEDEDEEDDQEQGKRKAKFKGAFAHMVQQAENYRVIPTASRSVKMIGFPDITVPQFSEKTGKELKPYIGPPKQHYTQGHPYTPIQRVEFNPGSRTHIWMRLMLKYGWDPVKFTPGGPKVPPAPMVDEDVLSGLPYPEAKQLAEYFLVLKRLGMLATGKKAWLKFARETVHPNGKSTYRVHGRMNTNGAATGRATHSDPNMGQVPANHAAEANYPDSPELHGIRCRRLFIASPGYELAGFDGSSLELRMLAHFVSLWDKGEYAAIVHEGRKEEGTDPHSWLRDLIGQDIMGKGDIGRDNSKTTMYARLYGAGNLKIGTIIAPHLPEKERMELGAMVKRLVSERFTAEARLQEEIVARVEDKGTLTGIDGRTLYIRKPHAALNSLLQSAGAVVMKKSLVVLDKDLQTAGLTPGRDYEYVGNIHDEVQADILPHHKPVYKEFALQALPKAGKFFNLRCPLAAEVKFGNSWADTH